MNHPEENAIPPAPGNSGNEERGRKRVKIKLKKKKKKSSFDWSKLTELSPKAALVVLLLLIVLFLGSLYYITVYLNTSK
jgi:hypothetical protein